MTDNPMTGERLDAIEERDNEATRRKQHSRETDISLAKGEDLDKIGRAVGVVRDEELDDYSYRYDILHRAKSNTANQSDVPDLVKEVRRLREEVLIVKARDSDTCVENRILFNIVHKLVAQFCTHADSTLDSMEISANADAMRLLAKAGRIELTVDVGRRVIGKWKKD